MATGFITDISSRDTRFGTYHDVYIDGKNLGGGKFPPKGVKVGDYVSYEIEKNAKGYDQLKAGSLSVESAPAGVAAPTPKQPSAISMDRQDVISRQAALNSALEFVSILSAADALPIGKSLASAKKADALKEIVMRYTADFFHLNTGVVYDVPEDVVGDVAQAWDEQE